MPVSTATASGDVRGLTAGEVEDRRRRGQVNVVRDGPSRTVGQILRANVLTRFNLLLGVLLVVVLFVAPIQDAAFGLVLVTNTGVGVVQELRAKWTLDRLTLLSAPRVRVVRDGEVVEVARSEVVLGDLVALRPGDQLVVDGTLVAAAGLEIDESLLTGESEPVMHAVGDECLSGSFVVAGEGRYLATRVGEDAYAAGLVHEARQFAPARSELRDGVDRLLKVISWLLLVTIPVLVVTQLRAAPGVEAALAGAVAGAVAMVPEGLVLLTSIAFAVGVVRLGRRSVLVQELAAVEGLARVDTVCFDKTGTLTLGRLRVEHVEVLSPGDAGEVEAALGALGGAEKNPNATLRAITGSHPDPGWGTPSESVPFSSARRWSGATFPGRGTYLLGAPESLLDADDPVRERVDRAAAGGARVLVLARGGEPLASMSRLPTRRVALAFISIGDGIRDTAASTVAWFSGQGVRVKVVSGDHPATVSAVAAAAGVDIGAGAIDGAELPDDPGELAALLDRHHVFGRVAPEQKQAMVRALRAGGHTVAMTGDGVNDVLALKEADLGVAMGSGTGAARSVAQVVLLDGDFDALPEVVAEGRRVVANIERVANLFVTKTVYAFALVIAVGVLGLVFPFRPRHLTLVGTVTIGVPAFFLALEQGAGRYRPGFLRRVLRFSIPAGLAAAAGTFCAYWLADQEGATLQEARTIATMVLGAVGLYVLRLVSGELTALRRNVLLAVGAGFVLALGLPVTRDFFALTYPPLLLVLAAVGVAALTDMTMGLVANALRALRAARARRQTRT